MIDNKLSQLNMISGHDVDEYNPWQLKNLKFLSNFMIRNVFIMPYYYGLKFLGKKNFSINFARYCYAYPQNLGVHVIIVNRVNFIIRWPS